MTTMTPNETSPDQTVEAVAVTQADRIAAERHYRFVQGCMKREKRHSDDVIERTASQILHGRWDKDESVQAFARHRLSTTPPPADHADLIARLLDLCTDWDGRVMGDDEPVRSVPTCGQIRTVALSSPRELEGKRNCFGVPATYRGFQITQGADDQYYATPVGHDRDEGDLSAPTWEALSETIDNEMGAAA